MTCVWLIISLKESCIQLHGMWMKSRPEDNKVNDELLDWLKQVCERQHWKGKIKKGWQTQFIREWHWIILHLGFSWWIRLTMSSLHWRNLWRKSEAGVHVLDWEPNQDWWKSKETFHTFVRKGMLFLKRGSSDIHM